MNRIYVLSLILLGFAFAGEQSAFAQTDTPAEIQSYVDGRGGKKNYPTEISKIVRGDLNGDGNEDAVVQYIVQEGSPGNYFASYIATFLNKGGKMVFASEMEAGTKLAAGLVPVEIVNKRLAVDRFAANSQTKIGTLYYKLVGKKLARTK